MESLLDLWNPLNRLQKIAVVGVAALIGLDVYVASPLNAQPHKAPPSYTVGQDIDVAITLVTTDARTLACASPEVVAGKHCEFRTQKEKWAKPEDHPTPMEILAPYKTTDDLLFLIPGLFSEPSLKQRLEVDPPNMNTEHARFVANCKLHIEGKIDQIETRWQLNGPWGNASDGWVGTISACVLSDA